MKLPGITAWLFAMLLSSGCASDGSTDDESLLLNVDNLWQGGVPVASEFSSCPGEGITSLLIPYSILEDEVLQIELYGCWLDANLITCDSDGAFGEARIDTQSNKVNISLWKGDYPYETCNSQAPEFGKYRTFEISGPWPRGELEIVVQNSDEDQLASNWRVLTPAQQVRGPERSLELQQLPEVEEVYFSPNEGAAYRKVDQRVFRSVMR